MSVPRKWEQRRVAAAVKMFDAIDGWFSLEDEGSVIGRQKHQCFCVLVPVGGVLGTARVNLIWG